MKTKRPDLQCSTFNGSLIVFKQISFFHSQISFVESLKDCKVPFQPTERNTYVSMRQKEDVMKLKLGNNENSAENECN